jgi:hypothetical protein
VLPEAMPAPVEALAVDAPVELLGEGWPVGWDAAEAAAVGSEDEDGRAVAPATPAGLPVGFDVAVLTGGGVVAMGAGQTPAGEGGTELSLWPS